jgi:hypothetical protein
MGRGKKLCSQIAETIHFSLGKEHLTLALRKKEFFGRFVMGYITRVLINSRNKGTTARPGYEFMGRIDRLEEVVARQLACIVELKNDMQRILDGGGPRKKRKAAHFNKRNAKKKRNDEMKKAAAVNVEGDGAAVNVIGDGALTKAVAMKIKGVSLGLFLERICRLEVKVQEHAELIAALQMDLGLERTRRGAAQDSDLGLWDTDSDYIGSDRKSETGTTNINSNPATAINGNPAPAINTNPATAINTNPDLAINTNPALNINTNPATAIYTNRLDGSEEGNSPRNRRKLIYLQKKKQLKKRHATQHPRSIYDSEDETEFEGEPKDPPPVASKKLNNPTRVGVAKFGDSDAGGVFEPPQVSSGKLKEPP